MKNIKLIIENAIADHTYYKMRVVDGRRKYVRMALKAGFTKDKILTARLKHDARLQLRGFITDVRMTFEQKKSFLNLVSQCEFNLDAKSSRYNCTGIDWCAYHRPSSSGGWVCIAPDEPGNNWHVTDPVLIKFLSKKYKVN